MVETRDVTASEPDSWWSIAFVVEILCGRSLQCHAGLLVALVHRNVHDILLKGHARSHADEQRLERACAPGRQVIGVVCVD